MGARSLWQTQGDWPGYPAVNGDVTADVVVVGAGVTGCACARRLAHRGLDVVVLEAREVAAGASGRNGSFASTGTGLSATELELHRLAASAMDEMLELAPAAVERTGSVWLARDDEVDELRTTITAMRDAGIACRVDAGAIPGRMRGSYSLAAVVDADGALLPATWVRTLALEASAAGARFFEGSPVKRVSGGVAELASGFTATAGAVVVACDGLIAALVPALEGIVYPVRGQVLATAPLKDTVITRPTHSDHGFYYYRPTSDGRIVLGGGRIADLEAEYTSEEETTATVQGELDRFLEEELGVSPATVTHRWAGIMGFSADLLPVVGEVPGHPGLWVCGGYSGVGNLPGYALGQIVADRIAGGPSTSLTDAVTVSRFATDRRLSPPPIARERETSANIATNLRR